MGWILFGQIIFLMILAMFLTVLTAGAIRRRDDEHAR